MLRRCSALLAAAPIVALPVALFRGRPSLASGGRASAGVLAVGARFGRRALSLRPPGSPASFPDSLRWREQLLSWLLVLVVVIACQISLTPRPVRAENGSGRRSHCCLPEAPPCRAVAHSATSTCPSWWRSRRIAGRGTPATPEFQILFHPAPAGIQHQEGQAPTLSVG